MEAINCITTKPFRNTIPWKLFFIFPFNITTGLNEESANAGYRPERNVPLNHSISINNKNHDCTRKALLNESPDNVLK